MLKSIIFVLVAVALSLPCNSQVHRPEDTLDLVNWNLEFFGDRHSDLPEEIIKTRAIMEQLQADAYALVEVVNTDSLFSLVTSLSGGYDYLLAPYGSAAPGPTSYNYPEAQKLAFVYRNSMFRNLSGKALLKNSSTAYAYWASGRYPYMVSAEVLGKDGQWRAFRFIILHAKAYSDYNSCNRRLAGARELKDTLDTYYANDRIIMLGDFNDDLDTTICPSQNESNYAVFVKDSSDQNSYYAPTLPLSLAGQSSISGYPSFLDHVILSNEVLPYYVAGSARLLDAEVSNWVSAYVSDVSDHYPVLTRYMMVQATPVSSVHRTEPAAIYPNPAAGRFSIRAANQEITGYRVFTLDGRPVAHGAIQAPVTTVETTGWPPGCYLLILTGNTGGIENQLLIVR